MVFVHPGLEGLNIVGIVKDESGSDFQSLEAIEKNELTD